MTATNPNRSESDNSALHARGDQALDLGPDAQAVLRHVRRNGTTTQEMLAFITGLTESRVNTILRILASEDLVDVTPGFAHVHVSPPTGGEADAR